MKDKKYNKVTNAQKQLPVDYEKGQFNSYTSTVDYKKDQFNSYNSTVDYKKYQFNLR